jgi:hypothetical protein
MMTVRLESNVDGFRRQMRRFKRRLLSKTAYRVYEDMRSSIQSAPGPSRPGEAPHTHPRLLRDAVAYAVEDEGAVIGPRFSVVADVGNAQEFGGEYRGEDYPERPFARPALERNEDFFAASVGGSFGE